MEDYIYDNHRIVKLYRDRKYQYMYCKPEKYCIFKNRAELGSCPPNLERVTRASIHAPRQRNSRYVQMVRWSIYETRLPEHPHWPIRLYKRCPPGTLFAAPLHGILPGYGPTPRYVYIYVFVYSLSRSLQVLHLCVKSLPIVASGIRRWRHHRHRHQHFRAGSRFQLDPTYLFFDLIRFNCFSV